MIGMKVEGLAAVQAKLKSLDAELRTKVESMAINKVAAKAGAEINRQVSGEFAISRSDVKNSITIRRSHSKKLEAFISIFGSPKRKGRSMNLIHFLAAGNGMRARGVKAKEAKALAGQLGFKIKRTAGLKQIQGAFIGNDGRTVFRRVEGQMKSRSGPMNKHTQMIDALRVIGVSQMFNSKRISRVVLEKIRDDMLAEVDRAIKAATR